MKQMNLFEVPLQGKPFLKWAGGKGQLIDAIATHLPNMDNIDTYIEPYCIFGYG